MKLMTKTVFAVCAMIAAMPAMAATQIVNASGKLTGATGVLVGAKTYNVSFVDGTCASVYGACAASSFDFSSKADATDAANALLDQVFLDTKLGMFDSDPSKTLGCSDAYCVSIIAYTLPSTTAYSYVGSFNRSSTAAAIDGTIADFRGTLENTTSYTSANFARFTLAAVVPEVVDPPVVVVVPTQVAAVPEPATWAMLLVGFGMVAGAARYRRRNVKITFA
jgi:hypothetical protein